MLQEEIMPPFGFLSEGVPRPRSSLPSLLRSACLYPQPRPELRFRWCALRLGNVRAALMRSHQSAGTTWRKLVDTVGYT